MEIDPRAGQQAIASDLVDVPKLIAAYFEEQPNPEIPAQRVVFGTSGHRGSSFTKTIQRMAHPGDYAGDLSLPEAAQDRRPAFSWNRHPCVVTACGGQRARSPGREWYRRDVGRARGVHANSCDLARHPYLQSGTGHRLCGWHRDYAIA